MKRFFVVCVFSCLLSSHSAAHHAFTAEYDSNSPVVVTGTVSRVEWRNPHVWVHVEVRNGEGETELWRFWEDSPSILEQKGIREDVLEPGDAVKVYGFQARDGSPRASIGKMTFEDGTRVFGRTKDTARGGGNS